MHRPVLYAAIILLVWTSTRSGVAQVNTARTPGARDSVVTDGTLGISFLGVGQAERQLENGYRMSLLIPGGNINRATAAVSVNTRRFVDLPGSYGGILYLDEPSATPLVRNMLRADSIAIDGLRFRREFWAVYAGMGAWEGVINCYALHNRQYYILSFHAAMTMGRPGEVVDGEEMSAELLRIRLADMLSDAREPAIQKFNDLLSSFHVGK